MGEPVFVLDAVENPHPRMLACALAARRLSEQFGGKAATYWHGYLAAMCDATGCDPEEVNEWMDRA